MITRKESSMNKPLILGILGLFVGYFLYLVIWFFSPEPMSQGTGGVIAIVTGVVFFTVGSWYYSPDRVKNPEEITSVPAGAAKVETLTPEEVERKKIEKYGIEVVICPSCNTINSLSLIKCTKCSTSLAKEKPIHNPYL
jgi:ribosomal protein L40E